MSITLIARWIVAALFMTPLLASSPAAADWRLFQPVPDPSLFELRLGVFSHDPLKKEAGSVDLNAEIVFGRLPLGATGAWTFLVPRPHFGFMGNTAGMTNYAYAGGTWTLDVTSWFFVESIFGLAIHDGHTIQFSHDREDLGCHTLFHTGANAGARLTERLSILASWKHISNAGLCSRNNGLDVYGVQLGWRF